MPGVSKAAKRAALYRRKRFILEMESTVGDEVTNKCRSSHVNNGFWQAKQGKEFKVHGYQGLIPGSSHRVHFQSGAKLEQYIRMEYEKHLKEAETYQSTQMRFHNKAVKVEVKKREYRILLTYFDGGILAAPADDLELQLALMYNILRHHVRYGIFEHLYIMCQHQIPYAETTPSDQRLCRLFFELDIKSKQSFGEAKTIVLLEQVYRYMCKFYDKRVCRVYLSKRYPKMLPDGEISEGIHIIFPLIFVTQDVGVRLTEGFNSFLKQSELHELQDAVDDKPIQHTAQLRPVFSFKSMNCYNCARRVSSSGASGLHGSRDDGVSYNTCRSCSGRGRQLPDTKSVYIPLYWHDQHGLMDPQETRDRFYQNPLRYMIQTTVWPIQPTSDDEFWKHTREDAFQDLKTSLTWRVQWKTKATPILSSSLWMVPSVPKTVLPAGKWSSSKLSMDKKHMFQMILLNTFPYYQRPASFYIPRDGIKYIDRKRSPSASRWDPKSYLITVRGSGSKHCFNYLKNRMGDVHIHSKNCIYFILSRRKLSTSERAAYESDRSKRASKRRITERWSYMLFQKCHSGKCRQGKSQHHAEVAYDLAELWTDSETRNVKQSRIDSSMCIKH